MKSKLSYILLTGIFIGGIHHLAYADYQPNFGYQNPPSHHKEHNKFSISVNLPGQNAIVVNPHGVHRQGFHWVSLNTGQPLPRHAVVSGSQPVPPATLFVCRAFYRGGVHPGKLYEGRCNIGWGGSEVSLTQYEVLSSRTSLNWVPASYGNIPAGAIQGGYQQDGPLYICQARYHGGIHSGKVIGQNCNFGWGGREISKPYYNVLVG